MLFLFTFIDSFKEFIQKRKMDVDEILRILNGGDINFYSDNAGNTSTIGLKITYDSGKRDNNKVSINNNIF